MAHQSTGMEFTPIQGAELQDFLGDSNATTSGAPDAFITHYCHLTYLERHDLRDLLFAWLEVSHNTTDLLSLCPITRSQRESFFSSIFSDWDPSKPTCSPKYIPYMGTDGKIEVGVWSQDLPISREERERALEHGEQEPTRQHKTARQAGQKAFMVPSMEKTGKKTVIAFLYMDADGEFNDFPGLVTFKPGGLTREDYMRRSIKEYDESKTSRAYQYNIEAIIDTARKRIVKYCNDGFMEGRLPVSGHRVPTRVVFDPILPQIESGDACWET
ncbi:uncharacterized protein FFUJ_13329 [Fusarium fujikuroi IMI 58289]|uniref:Uncharacterized protein n=2 Tax=Fusarium fujikuroi TaxID=5127 RepID=S0DX91_GIBF5|nr:uncharacterized protein FFUJ_13329 [Fusarium fujikuroi IMI 58289]KLO97663.1 uncharacterized protein LW94_13871 [Fusarium fujikuroi]KLP01427.1 uncharacterized protein Y057_9399 [Fusarium fujikuroi]QGI63176.1 hypothetical protein CEK27_007147 [Fusarium fujikuroi]QGI80343.1 hypothetical protein CEK25_007072 [Fusarium fujikuroi]QGI94060.1 hypothetical protein CEK26_007129 [Fusarium fujikuroi]